jgi:quercetin dioxygenase-like cupin family protein
MGKISFVTLADTVADTVPVNPCEEDDEALRDAKGGRVTYFPVDGERLGLFEIHLEPGIEVASHAHSEDEIIVVTSGEIHVGRRVLGAGSSVYVEKETLYGFRAGPEGCTFLNFRGGARADYLPKHEVMARRAARS